MRMPKNKQERRNLTSGSVSSNLLELTLPMMLGILSMVGFNLVDTYFVGQLGKNELAALSFTFPVITMIFSIVQGMGIGATALIAKSFGRGDIGKARRETTDSLVLSALIAFIFVLLGYFTIDPLFTALGASSEVLPLIREYMSIWYLTILFVVVPFIGNSAIRATGDARTPSYIMLFAVAINAILDPILIFGWGIIPALGLKGAAIATSASRGMTLILAFYILYKREKLITFHQPGWKVIRECWGSILYIGLPSGFSRMITPVAQSIITAFIAVYGQASVAGYGVGTRIEFLVMSVLFALSASIGPFTGQNFGAGHISRIQKSINQSSLFSLMWGFLLAIVCFVFARPIAIIFSDNEEVIKSSVLFLKIVPIGFGFQGIVQIINSNLNTLNKPLPASILLLIQALILYIPLAWIGSELFDIAGIFAATSLTYAIGGILSYFYDRRIYKKLVQSETFNI